MEVTINNKPLSEYSIAQLEKFVEAIEDSIYSRPVTEEQVLASSYERMRYVCNLNGNGPETSLQQFSDMIRGNYPCLLEKAVREKRGDGIPPFDWMLPESKVKTKPTPKPAVMDKCGLCRSTHRLYKCVQSGCGYTMCGSCVAYRSSGGETRCLRCGTDEFGSDG
jgi:hypothetical protein